MNRPGKNALLTVALLLAAAVAYFDDPVLSDPQRGPETTPVPTASPTPTSTPPEISATSTPPTATSTADINSPPTVQVMTFGGIGQARPFPDDEVYKVNISGSRVSIKLRGQDEDGNLDYLAIVDEDDEVQGRSDCDAAMGSECTLEVTIPSPAEYDRAFTYHGIAVDSEGAVSEKSVRIEVTSVWDKGGYASGPTSSPRPPSTPTPTPRPPTPPPTPVALPESMIVPAGDQAVVEHESGAMIEIPEGATNPVPPDWSAGPELTDVTETVSDEMVTVSITEFEAPSPSVVEVQSAYDITVVDQDGEDVVLREPVTITLPYTLPEGKTTEDLDVVYWNEPLERWESVEGGVVDETEQTITVDMDHLTGVGVVLFVNPVRLLALVQATFAGVDVIGTNYEEGHKHAITLHGALTGKFLEVGNSLVLDVDDILSLGKEKGEGYTVEGEEGFVTFGMYRHFALEPAIKEVSAGVTVSIPKTGKFMGAGPSGYNNDLSFESSFALASFDAPLLQFPGFLVKLSTLFTDPSLGLLTLNSNGNFNPVEAQLNKCADCVFSIDVNVGIGAETLGIDVKALSTSLVVASGEFNTNSEDILQDLMQGQCGQSRCEITWSEFIALILKSMEEEHLEIVYTLGEKVGLIHEYTAFENMAPADVADGGWGYVNAIKDVTGGHDVNSDGRGDMVFPSENTAGTPLQVWTTGDGTENQRHYLEVVSITEGWSIEFNAADTSSDLNASVDSEPSGGALLRVDYDAQALSVNTTHWLVTATTTAPSSGNVTFRLKHDRSLLEGLLDEQLDQSTVTLWKDKQLSDLSIRAQVSPDPIRTDEAVTYTVFVENDGPDTADDVELNVYLASNLGVTLEEAALTDRSLSCDDDIVSLWNLVCNLGDLDAGETATATLEFMLKPDFPTGTPITAAFAVTSEVVRGAPLPKEELTPGNNSTSTTARTASYRAALVALYEAADGPNWTVSTNWLSDEPVYTWFGVRTNGRGRVTELNLAGLGLDGEIPVEIGDLTKLRWLNLARNSDLTGDLPAEMAQLTELEGLALGENDHTGPVPSWLGDLTKLRELGLGHNQLTGTIPIELRQLTGLEVLYLGGNGLIGSVPDWLGEFESLNYLYLSGNSFTGCLPAGLGNFQRDDIDQLGLPTCGAEVVPFARDRAKEFDPNIRLYAPSEIWSDGTTMWVSYPRSRSVGTFPNDPKIHAYNLAMKERDPSKDFDTLVTAENIYPGGIWSDGTTMWVADSGLNAVGLPVNPKLYAYNLAMKEREPSKDFDTLIAAENIYPRGIWSDGTTMWVADYYDSKLYAYNLSTKERDPAKDFDSLVAAGNTGPSGIWSDGTTMWVPDITDDKIYAYNLTTKVRDSAKDFDTLAAAGNIAPYSSWSDGTTMWVLDRGGRLYAYSLTTKARDSAKDLVTLVARGNTKADGIWSDGVTVWVSDGGDQKVYAYNLSTRARDSAKDFDSLIAAENTYPRGIWSDGTTMWIADWSDAKLYAYNLMTKVRDSDKDFDTLIAAGNARPYGIWSDGTTMWVLDITDDKIYAYNLTTKAHDSDKDIDTPNGGLGIWSDGTTMWVAGWGQGKLYAYNLTTKMRDSDKDFETLGASGNFRPYNIWSDGTTMWVSDQVRARLYAYNLTTKSHDSAKDIDTLKAPENNSPYGIWSDGTTMWVVDEDDDSLDAYNLTTKARDSAKDFGTLEAAGNSRPQGIWSDGTTMWVTDLNDAKIYAYNLATKAYDSDKDFDTLEAAGNSAPFGVWSDGTTMWVVDVDDAKIYAYNLTTKARDSAKDFETLEAAGNSRPQGIWSDGTTMWAADWGDGMLYAYNLTTKARDSVKDFSYSNLVLTGECAPTGIWSDGTTMWVADWHDEYIKANNMPP